MNTVRKIGVSGFAAAAKRYSSTEVADMVSGCLREPMQANGLYGGIEAEDVGDINSLEAITRRMIWATYKYADPKRLDFLLQKCGIVNMVDSPEDELAGILTADEILRSIDKIKGGN